MREANLLDSYITLGVAVQHKVVSAGRRQSFQHSFTMSNLTGNYLTYRSLNTLNQSDRLAGNDRCLANFYWTPSLA